MLQYYYYEQSSSRCYLVSPFFISSIMVLLILPSIDTFTHQSLPTSMKLIPRQFSLPLELHENNFINDIISSNHPHCMKEAAADFVHSLRDSSRPKMIVFDKDGTLGDCTASLRRWVHHMTSKIKDTFTDHGHLENIVHMFHTEIGWDAVIDDVVPSAPVAAGTWDDIVRMVYDFLVRHQDLMVGSAQIVTKEVVEQWHAELGDLHEHDTPLLDDLVMVMHACQELGYTIAICTSDDRQSTDKALRRWGIDEVVDYSICGNEVEKGKPNALPLLMLCQQASSNQRIYIPRNCIVVGDTSSDTGMARAAKAGFCVGVLTGSGTVDQLLDTGAHLILPDVGHIPALLKNFQQLAEDQGDQK